MTETDNQRSGDCSSKPMAERVEFDIIAKGHGARGCKWRIWTDGDLVRWESSHDGDGRHGGERVEGMMPRRLFLLGAHTLSERCENMAHGDDWDMDSALLSSAMDTQVQPITQAMAWPMGSLGDAGGDDDSDASDAVKFGFGSIATATSIDGPPECLRPLRSPATSGDTRPDGPFQSGAGYGGEQM